MITPLGWLERVPTYKEQQENLANKDLSNLGFLGYPLLMASDILIYQPQFVPVGNDQTAHVELTREVARRFNQFYKLDGKEVLPEPKVLLTPSPKLPGNRRPQDVEELWQHDPDHGYRAGGAAEAQDHGDGSGADPADRPGRPGQMSRGRSA